MPQYHLNEWFQQRFPSIGPLEVNEVELTRLQEPTLTSAFLLATIINQSFLATRRASILEELSTEKARLPELEEKFSRLTTMESFASGRVSHEEQVSLAQEALATRKRIALCGEQNAKFDGIFEQISALRTNLATADIPLAQEMLINLTGISDQPKVIEPIKEQGEIPQIEHVDNDAKTTKEVGSTEPDFDIARYLLVGILGAVINNNGINGGFPPVIRRVETPAPEKNKRVKPEKIVTIFSWQEFVGPKAQLSTTIVEGLETTIKYLSKIDGLIFKECEEGKKEFDYLGALGIIYCYTKKDLDALLQDQSITPNDKALHLRRIACIINRVHTGEYNHPRKFNESVNKILDETDASKPLADIIERSFQSINQSNIPSGQPSAPTSGSEYRQNHMEKDAAKWVKTALSRAAKLAANDATQKIKFGSLYRESQISIMDGALHKSYIDSLKGNNIIKPSGTDVVSGRSVDLYSGQEILFMMVYKQLPQRYKKGANRKIFKEFFHKNVTAILEAEAKKEALKDETDGTKN